VDAPVHAVCTGRRAPVGRCGEHVHGQRRRQARHTHRPATV